MIKINTEAFDRIDFFEEFDKLKQYASDKVVLSEGPRDTDLTVTRLDELSARVYRFLKEQNIGKEDMVNIFLPRGCSTIVCLYGVWKAGAAAVVLEDDYPKERVAFIRKDCNCKLIIDQNVWERILNTSPLYGHEPLDLHAAAFAVYTSGTTGNPKGILHEYGKIPTAYITQHWDGEPVFTGDESIPVFFPLSFAPTMMSVPFMFMNGTKLLIIPDHIRKDFSKLKQYFIDYNVNNAYFPPSMFRSIGDLGPQFNKVYMSSEPASGIWRDPKEIRILNAYGSSEMSAVATMALLDKPYEIAPIGASTSELKVWILDEDGKEVLPGEAGELCCENPYTRGYINLPEEDAKTFANGIYHTGDLAKKGSDGYHYIIGRIKDTVSINGKRAEPAEIEAVIRRITGIDQIAVCAFSGERGSYLCAYHLGETDMDINELKDKIKDYVPYYMIPSYFIKLDSFPKNANGKLDKKSFPRPSVMDYLGDYVAPTNEIEKMICEKMQNILSIPKIGIHDDFFLLGGDSLLAINLIVSLGLDWLSIDDIYSGKTPARIAERYSNNEALKLDNIDEADKKCREISYRLTKTQQEIYEYQQVSPNNCMYNIATLIRVYDINADELSHALEQVIANHPSLLTVLHKDDSGNIMQSYAPEFMKKIEVEKISEEDLMKIKDDLIRPYEMLNQPLYRCRVFSTPVASYFFVDFHHIICDGFSTTILSKEIVRALSGEELKKDYYYYVLSKRLEAEDHSPEAKKYFESKYGNTNWTKVLPHDFELPDNPADMITLESDISKKEYETIKDNTGLGKNALYITAGLLALAYISSSDDVMLSWVFNGRKNQEEMNIVGELFYDPPVALHIDNNLLMSDAIEDIRYQIEKGIEFSEYPYLRNVYNTVVTDDVTCIIYQRDYYEFNLGAQYHIEQIDIEEKDRASQNSLDMEIIENEDIDCLLMDYSARFYKKETIEFFGNTVRDFTKRIAKTKDFGKMTVREFLDAKRRTI